MQELLEELVRAFGWTGLKAVTLGQYESQGASARVSEGSMGPPSIQAPRARRPPAGSLAAIVVGALFAAGCATTPAERLRVVVESREPTTTLADLTLDPARNYVVITVDGRTTRGRVVPFSGALIVTEAARQPRAVPDADIVLVGVVAGASRMRRGWIGAAAGAIVSLPFGISMRGDMAVPAAILGAQLARRTGDEQVEVLLDRRQLDLGSPTSRDATGGKPPALVGVQPTPGRWR